MAKRITRNIKATSIDLDKMKDYMLENDLISDGEKAYILVGNQLLEITSGGDEVDLSPYAKKTDLNSYAKKTELPDLKEISNRLDALEKSDSKEG